jgi:hypothetical protein
MVGGTPANPAALAGWVFWLGFLDQHYRDAIDYWIEDVAAWASQVVRPFELHFRVTFRASEDFE